MAVDFAFPGAFPGAGGGGRDGLWFEIFGGGLEVAGEFGAGGGEEGEGEEEPEGFHLILEADFFEEFVKRELHADVEVSEVGVACGDFVEAHFVDDVFDLDGVFGEEGDAPFVFIESGGSGDELEDLAGVLAAGFHVAFHELGAGVVIEGIPVVVIVRGAAFGHGVETDGGPVREDGIHAVFEVVDHALVEFFEGGDVFVTAFGHAFFADEGVLTILFTGGGVFGPFGLGEVGIGGGEDIDAKGEGEAFFEMSGVEEIGGEEHEAEVGLGGGDGEGEELGVLVCADFLNELAEVGFGLALFGGGEEGPLALINGVVEVHDVPTFSGHEGVG